MDNNEMEIEILNIVNKIKIECSINNKTPIILTGLIKISNNFLKI